jgi:cytochrome P450
MAGSTAQINELRFWARPLSERAAVFAGLRALPGPVFYPEAKVPFVKTGDGFWAVVRHADVLEASSEQEVFSSEPSATSIPDIPRFLGPYLGSLINMDDPRHAKLRRVVTRAFSARTLAKTEQDIADRAARIVDELITAGPGDFVAAVAARLPVEVICDMLGIPEADHAAVVRMTTALLGYSDPEYSGITHEAGRVTVALGLARMLRAARGLHRIATRIARDRVKNPGHDLVSALVRANVDGERLTTREVGSFFLLLVAAGNETTRTAIAHALKLFTDHPDQRELLLQDFDTRIAGAVEEVVRFASPIIYMRRNVTRDYVLGGQQLKKGDKVLLYYYSANRDENVFADADRFDIGRRPNPHVSFGAPGAHFCLGANLARREIAVMLREVFTRLPDIRADSEPDRLLSSFLNGCKRLPCTFTAPPPPSMTSVPDNAST